MTQGLTGRRKKVQRRTTDGSLRFTEVEVSQGRTTDVFWRATCRILGFTSKHAQIRQTDETGKQSTASEGAKRSADRRCCNVWPVYCELALSLNQLRYIWPSRPVFKIGRLSPVTNTGSENTVIGTERRVLEILQRWCKCATSTRLSGLACRIQKKRGGAGLAYRAPLWVLTSGLTKQTAHVKADV